MHVRPAAPGDLPALTAIYNHYVEHTHVTFDEEPIHDRSAWFAQFSDRGPHRLFVAEDGSGAVIGYANSSQHRKKPGYDTTVETTVYLAHDAPARGGIGRALYEALFAAIEGEDLHRAFAGVALPNDASIAFHESLGFTHLGTFREVGRKFGKYWDVAWFEKPLG